MKTYRTEFHTGFSSIGINPESVSARNSGLLVDCMNVCITKNGLLGYSPDIKSILDGDWAFVDSVTGAAVTITRRWPFPQVFLTDVGLFIGALEGLYWVSDYAPLTLYSFGTGAVTWPWSCIAIGKVPAFTSGDAFVYFDDTANAYKVNTGTGAATDAWKNGWNPPVSACLSRGQVFAVGSKQTTPEAAIAECRIIRWSEIGAFRFYDATATTLRNEAGEMYLTNSDVEQAMCVLPMKNGVIVYGSYSATILEPVSAPAPTFKIDRSMSVGIANPLAAAGTDKKHVVIDTDGTLWVISLGLNSVISEKSIGYSDIFSEMQEGLSIATGKGIISVVYNPNLEEFYISNGVKSYLFNDSGLTRIDKAITSYVNMSGSLMSVGLDDRIGLKPLGATTLVEQGEYAYIETDTIDFNMSAIKTINSVEIAGSMGPTGQAEVMIKWRNKSSEAWRETTWRRCSPAGIARPTVSGKDFRICYRVVPYTGVEINGITVEWQLSDKTSVRGSYTNVSSLTAKSN